MGRPAVRIRRRTFLTTTAAAGGVLAVSHLVPRGVTALVARSPEAPDRPVEDWVPTTCWIGKQDCGILARRIGGRVVKLEGHPGHPLNVGTLCPKGVAQIIALYDPHRVKTPLIRTNGKGQPGQWRQASWDEALDLVARRIREARAKDPRLVVWQKGRSKGKAFYDEAFVKACGATKLHHGAFCSDAGYRAGEYTVGISGVLHPDFRYTRYLLAWGWNGTNAGGNQLCWITWPQQMVAARERGMKIVVIDPRLRGMGPFADEWLPIRPGTDLALALALCHELVRQGTVDREYLARYTNAPFLVGPDGFFVRVGGKEQIWDRRHGRPRPADSPDADPALDGEFTVGGVRARPAFAVFAEHLSRYTPEWAAQVCGVPAEAIRRVARELGEEARIGSTAVVDGVTLPYRPVAIMAYHVAQQELGFQAVRAMITLMMLLGAVGAVGGQRFDVGGWKIHENFDKLEHIEIADPPYNIWLKDSPYFPINSNNSAVVAKVLQDPDRYGVRERPEVLLVHMSNPLVAFASQPDILEGFKKIPFVAVIDPWLSETADYLADVILPAATLEKYEGPSQANNQYLDGVAMRLPVMAPLFQSRGDIDIYLDLCERAGILYGPGGYLDRLNEALHLTDPYRLPLDRKPTVREIVDRWARSQGIAEGVAFFEKNGVKVKGPVPPAKAYGYAASPPFGGVRHRLYGEGLLRYRAQMQARGVPELYWRDYTPLPTWRAPTMDGSPAAYDLYLISYKMIEFKQSRSSFIPLLAELAPRQRLDINARTARERGIRDGDEVWVESHNALTGETRRVRVRAHLTEAIRPDTVGMPHHYGLWTHPWATGQGPTPNALFFTGEGYVANTADQSFHVKVRVWRAEEGR
ncbi:MAG: molybdopterin-dependent oxidoreductase [Armatimonadota bacterium]|nr:molybdopterin-dependent oxidoreductase [Armatimonadota bacterium]MDR7437877.1 molybdopterin-dependent oxidoreductase [Armatimonadota bacterium]MDR7473309.1 molybdopterin-dependent oxidoreductase [Armatimonadota bacterium]MDR7507649.1 molybdopterin-dependent oxidoreductase [Armatimonadota bacterium]MDR7510007.1 molybdopterin-dependent oxidoreductase [Armatimonadota bacterium]